MRKKLFAGIEAVDSILQIAESTNDKLIQKANQTEHDNNAYYQPWMSIPKGLVKKTISLKMPVLDERFLNESSLESIRNFIVSLNSENEKIISHDKHNFYVSKLNEDELEKFNSKLKEAEQELFTVLPFFKPLVEKLVQVYIPMENPANEHDFDYGMSAMWFKGAIFYEKKQLPSLHRRVENLAHEIAHQMIINYQLNDFLINGDLNEEVYSGIRKIPRPAILSFHGAAALSYMLLIAKTYQDQKRIDELRDGLQKTLDSLNQINFTRVGRKIFEEMHEFL